MTDAPSHSPEPIEPAPQEASTRSPAPRAPSTRNPPLAQWTFCLPADPVPSNRIDDGWLEFLISSARR